MRLLSGLTLVAFCLTLAGCGTTQRSRGTASRTTGNQPFLGVPDTKDAETSKVGGEGSGEGGGPERLAKNRKLKGTLAGQVLDSSRRRVPGAIIQVVEMIPPRNAVAPMSVVTDKDGYFDLYSLEVGQWYRLTARLKSGNRYLTGSTRVQCTNVHVVITLTGEEPIPGESAASGDTPARTEVSRDDGERAATTAGAQPSPFRQSVTEGVTTPLTEDERQVTPAVVAPSPAPAPAVSPGPAPSGSEHIAQQEPKKNALQEKEKGGFRVAPPAASIPGPGRDPVRKPIAPQPYTPPSPPTNSSADEPLETSTASSAALPSAPPTPPSPTAKASTPARTVVPSCVRVGNQVVDFALFDQAGNVWELSKKRSRGSKLTLIDFWSSNCRPCCAALPFVVKLDRLYRRQGLDVVGIANEEGTFAEKQSAIRKIQKDYGISYTMLLSGGGTGDCPVIRQFGVYDLPTLVLLDGSGKIIWKARGLNDYYKRSLEATIQKRLK